MDSREIFLGNDYAAVAGPIYGRNPSTGERELLHSTAIMCRITADPRSDVPIGTLEKNAPESGDSGEYIVYFDASEINASLAAIAEGATVWRVVEGPNDFRVADPMAVRGVRRSGP